MGLILCKLEVPYRRNHYYFCSEFVSEILAYSQAIELPKLPCLMKPSDYLLFEELECLYQGYIGELIKYRDLCYRMIHPFYYINRIYKELLYNRKI